VHRFLVLLGAFGSLCCATSHALKPPTDLGPAREALEAARQAGAVDKAAEMFARAQVHLNEAEALVSDRNGEGPKAEGLARLSTAEAECALALARASSQTGTNEAETARAQELERLSLRSRRAEEEQHRLEERLALLARDLELTETELIRTKARLKGNETKAEASSAIAEARILTRRIADEKGRSSTLARCQRWIARAEGLLEDENYGAAVFFAMKAQDLAKHPEPTANAKGTGADLELPSPQARYAVKGDNVRVRAGPSTSADTIGTLSKGTVVQASVTRGDWVRITVGEITGWVARHLLE